MKGHVVTDINPCASCKKMPEDGFYPGDYAIECPDCFTGTSKHMVDYPHKDFQNRAAAAKADAIVEWNELNPKG